MKISFSALAWAKYQALMKAHDIEVSALGIVDEKDPFLVTDLFAVAQEGTSVSTKLDPSALADLAISLCDQGIDLRRVRLWAHVHPKMKVFWSGTDQGTIEALGRAVSVDVPGYFLLSVVINDTGDVLGRVDQWAPFRHTWDRVAVDVRYELPDVAEWLAHAKTLVRTRSATPKPPVGPNLPFLVSRPSLGLTADLAAGPGVRGSPGELCDYCDAPAVIQLGLFGTCREHRNYPLNAAKCDQCSFSDAVTSRGSAELCEDCAELYDSTVFDRTYDMKVEVTCPTCRGHFECFREDPDRCPHCRTELEFRE